jgi:hypothetical protein
LTKGKIAILVPSTVNFLYQQTKKAQSERSKIIQITRRKNEVTKKLSTSLKQARSPGIDTAELS